MDILNLKILRGPNYWSNYRKNLIVMKLDLKEFEELPTNLIPGFDSRIKDILPSLYVHYCSPGKEGGFFERVTDGTWLGHVIEHVALELQCLAGMECNFGRTRSTQQKGVYHVVFSYKLENAGIYAAKAAVNLVESLARQTSYDFLEQDIKELKQIVVKEGLGPSTQAIIDEAISRSIPYYRLDSDSLCLLGQGSRQRLICAATTSKTSTIAADIAADKQKTKNILAEHYIPVPHGSIIETLEQLDAALEQYAFPLVIKPLDGNHGNGINTNINSKIQAHAAFEYARAHSNLKKIIIEKFIDGSDYRFLVINFKVAAVAKRTPAMIVGDGTSTILELINKVNADPMRGDKHENYLTTIKLDEVTLAILTSNCLTLDSVLTKDKILYLKHAANISSGGTAEDVTDIVHPDNLILAERVARIINLDICGIDIVAENIELPINDNNGAIIEVNSSPGLRMHLSPGTGLAKNVAKPIIDMLFPAGKSSRIPLVAVTGTNGKTTTVRLIAHFAKMAGHCVGFTTTEGIYINHHEIYQGDCSGPASASVVLQDSAVDFAVLECARGGIIRSGLGFDGCDISIVTNLTEDHLGIDDINSLEELARVKAVVPLSTFENGYAILNADDELVYSMKKDLKCNIALFSMHADNKYIKRHCENGGLAAYVQDQIVVVRDGHYINKVAPIMDIPISFLGTAECMIQNVLPAVLAGVIANFKLPDLAKWLLSFYPSITDMPGRMNLFNFKNYKVMVDYGHNEGAFLMLQKYINNIDAAKKIGIIAATGDRRVEDIRKLGAYSAQIFDEIIIRHDHDGRGRSNQELTNLLLEGINSIQSNKPVIIISNEFDAIRYAMQHAVKDSFILYFPENVRSALDYINSAYEAELMAASSD